MTNLFDHIQRSSIVNIYENDVPKHRKKKESSTSKSSVKSKHKHRYVQGLFIDKEEKPHVGSYCNVCGKVWNIAWWETEPVENSQYGRCYRTLTTEEVFEKYKHLEKIHIEDVFQKYVSLSKEGDG